METKTISKKAKDLGKIVATLLVLAGITNGVGTLIPNKYDVFGGRYNRPCAAFRTNKVRKIALDEQSKYFSQVINYIKKNI